MDSELVLELRRQEQQRGTGALTVGDGAFHLVEGAIVAAECRRATGLDRMAMTAGLTDAEGWRRARAAAAVIRTMTGRKSKGLFLYLALDRGRANLAMARHRLEGIEEDLEV
ncbi:hypothetical protein [Nocardia sp. NPDC051981]|uniref:hypothetical protein n=1 Tax=Nocardia sp. NPDC051981 TaxID=3155417 RepID=UPI00342A07AF